ncbi:MAG: MBOAT family protein [Prevotella sp.]|nr:MBOAT family protein [Prevotella sp.]
MVVNSLAFIGFFLPVLVVYYLLQRNARWQNVMLLAASYWFYAQIDLRMAALLALMTLVFWLLGAAIGRAVEGERMRRAAWLVNVGVVVGVGALFYFKYLNFFASSVVAAANAVGLHLSWTAVHLLVPVGLSFFSFKLMSYVLDIYHGKLEAERGIVDFACYIAFFPTILSGPIDRPKPFLKQLRQRRKPDAEQLMAGLRRVLWGMFMKMCVADRLDLYVSAVLDNYPHHSSWSVLLACLLYPVQMYADFGGYSEMAIGVAQMMGLRVAENFRRPFFATNVAEYWRRWHMSLTSWLTDYVFMPCNIKLRDWGLWGTCTAILLNMLFVGLWHGANWTFFFFGLYHGLLFVPLMVSGQFFRKQKVQTGRSGLPKAPFVGKMVLTFLLVAVGQLIFRAPSMGEAVGIAVRAATAWQGSLFVDMNTMVNAALCLAVLFLADVHDEWMPQRSMRLPTWAEPWRWPLCVALEIVAILLFGIFDNNQFIYFQF